MPTKSHLDRALQHFQQVFLHLQSEFAKLQIGRANPSLLDDVQVEAYGTIQALKALASIGVLDGQTLQVQPWDKSILANVERAIRLADLNLNPINDGHLIRINIPPLTAERRQELAKIVHKLAEESRIAIRNYRHNALGTFKELRKNKEISEDEEHVAEKRLQGEVDDFNHKIDELAHRKEADIMKI